MLDLACYFNMIYVLNATYLHLSYSVMGLWYLSLKRCMALIDVSNGHFTYKRQFIVDKS